MIHVQLSYTVNGVNNTYGLYMVINNYRKHTRAVYMSKRNKWQDPIHIWTCQFRIRWSVYMFIRPLKHEPLLSTDFCMVDVDCTKHWIVVVDWVTFPYARPANEYDLACNRTTRDMTILSLYTTQGHHQVFRTGGPKFFLLQTISDSTSRVNMEAVSTGIPYIIGGFTHVCHRPTHGRRSVANRHRSGGAAVDPTAVWSVVC